ncbi:MAG: tripartite tricarboxylate transporter substrate-binding protein, partial [Thermodesulfobacteriota bacterium]
KELIALARSKPGKLNFASSSYGSAAHLAGKLFKTMAGVHMAHIPYKGSASVMTDLLGGHASLMFDPIPLALPHVKAGKLRLLAVTSDKRLPELPNVPTVAESGLPGFEMGPWFGVLAPAGTSLRKLSQSLIVKS